jgi:thioredoxin 1
MSRVPGSTGFDYREPTRVEVDGWTGPVLLEFGASWCGYCQSLAPGLAALLRRYPAVRHVMIEDGKGKPLGRSFRVKTWPTLVFRQDGRTIKQVARPSLGEVQEAIELLAAAAGQESESADAGPRSAC